MSRRRLYTGPTCTMGHAAKGCDFPSLIKIWTSGVIAKHEMQRVCMPLQTNLFKLLSYKFVAILSLLLSRRSNGNGCYHTFSGAIAVKTKFSKGIAACIHYHICIETFLALFVCFLSRASYMSSLMEAII